MHAVDKVLAAASSAAGDVDRFIHGSTIATNAVLEQKGAVVGVLTTAGFEDALDIGRQRRSQMYSLLLTQETPGFLAPGRRRLGIPERTGVDGSISEPLDEEAVREAVRRLTEREGVDAIAVCFLFSFFNPTHERRAREIIQEEAPGVDVSLSVEVDPQVREYERLVVTAFDAYLRGVVRGYVQRLEEALAARSISAKLQILQSRGGITSSEIVAGRPVTMLLSGLAAGVIGGRHAAQRVGFDNIITVDMGGTSCDVALVHEAKPLVAQEGKIGGWPLRLPMMEVNTIGAGGGSIAWVDDAGGLRVGPESAGSHPGPASYGRGGEAATVTDASLLLGYLNPGYFAGGELELDPSLADKAIGRLANRLSLDVTATAQGIHQIVNARMADEIRLVSIRRGYDHRKFALLALGGAGPTHGGALLRELGIPRMIVPAVPGVLSAFGLLVADIEHDQMAAVGARLDDLDEAHIGVILDELNSKGEEKMRRDGVAPGDIVIAELADLRYSGQSYDITVELPGRDGGDLITDLAERFHRQYERLYGHSDPSAPIEVMGLRTTHRSSIRSEPLAATVSGKRARPATRGERKAYFPDEGRFVATPVLQRGALVAGQQLIGPVIVEQADTTTVIHPGQSARVASDGSMIIEGAG